MTERSFIVLLGSDYAGKSTLMQCLARQMPWAFVSYDEDFVAEEHGLILRLKKDYLGEILSKVGRDYSGDFLLSCLQMCTVYLRDQVEGSLVSKDVLADSYYFKLVAKCILSGFVNEAIFSLWRSFPQPDEVLYLDTDPELLWGRCQQGEALNPFEHYGDEPTYDNFVRFQRDLRRLLLSETAHMPTRILDASRPVPELTLTVAQAFESRSGPFVGDDIRLEHSNNEPH